MEQAMISLRSNGLLLLHGNDATAVIYETLHAKICVIIFRQPRAILARYAKLTCFLKGRSLHSLFQNIN